jgi:NAD(P)H dehydrogenase (quinone)
VAAEALGGGQEGRALSLTGPEELGTAEVAATFAQVLGRPVVDHQPSLPGFLRHALSRGTPASLAAIMTSIGLVARLKLASGIDLGVNQVLGRKPTSFATFVADHRSVWVG